mmetsp:Transcript_29036/g.71476  ORF Transcript_29036/g.71476 Transcript_29036/m.71476 type:complete len:529 (+) Transcript_29036:177-1763(+)
MLPSKRQKGGDGGDAQGGSRGDAPRSAFAAGAFGDDYCDSPPRTMTTAIRHINQTHTASHERLLRPLVLLSGDWVMSDAGNRSPVLPSAVLAAPAAVASALRLHLPSARAYPVWGNHDLLPYNTHTGRPGQTSQSAARAFAPFVGEAVARKFADRGYYGIDLDSDLGLPAALTNTVRLLVLNTALFSPSNSFTHTADGHLAARVHLHWLREQLRAVGAIGGRALVVGHEPPGADWYTSRARHSNVASWWIPEHVRKYASIVAEFSETIALQTFGHTHADELRIVQPPTTPAPDQRQRDLDPLGGRGAEVALDPWQAKRGKPTVAFVAPPLTPYGAAFNPAVRAYSFALRSPSSALVSVHTPHILDGARVSDKLAAPPRRTKALILRDFTQWVLLLETSNFLGQPVWRIEYEATRAYGLADMSASSWLSALARMRAPGSVELLRYIDHTNVWDQGRERVHSLDGTRAMLCGVEHVDPDAFGRCRDAAAGAANSPPLVRHGDLLPAAGTLEEEGVSAVFATLPRGATATG